MNRVVRHAIAQGLKPVVAIQMATLNTAQHFGLEREIGSIAPGRRADLIITSDLADAARRRRDRPRPVDGGARQRCRRLRAYAVPDFARNTVRLGHPLTAADFNIAATGRAPDGSRHGLSA